MTDPESWIIFDALKTVVKRVPRRSPKDPNFLWIVYQIVKQWKPIRQIFEKKLSTHIAQEEDCFGSATIGLEVIWKWFGCQHQDTGEMEMPLDGDKYDSLLIFTVTDNNLRKFFYLKVCVFWEGHKIWKKSSS